ncbi:agamous-like MADS-box protein AGL61 [Argentina anserina]|uniref:agamous-like MADS-box protein AGL61 n=1 Tax=Argentina anserina TaxID=57926 RepID=UPI0021769338|nr:agamous-like MADS-box protein AGL61 [Potentilla anserina]
MMKKSKKHSLGRQKIAIAKIPKRSNLQVTFSKRCSGLFKKASELCTLCGVEIVIIIFSPANKPFSFGQPSVESIIDRFLNPYPSSFSSSTQQAQYCREFSVEHKLNMQLTQTQGHLEAEKQRGEVIDKMREDSERSSQCWWEKSIEELGLDELHILKAALEELKKNVTEEVHQMNDPCNSSVPFLMMNGIQTDHHLSDRNFFEPNGSDGIMIPPSAAYSFGHGHGFF